MLKKNNRGLSLDRTQLKLIAIISMVIDHTAWGFVDFYSPLGQFLHVCGRLTIPIMCFFIAEGFRKTHDLRQYIYRMIAYASISSIPFYVFFHNEYGYRQNIIFDYLLGLLMLTILESDRLKKWQKAALTVLLFAVSIAVGGWIITPELFILSFYYGRTFAEKAKWFILADLATVLFLVVAIILNQKYHFSHYDWVWWDKFYLLGFMLALPLLRAYNGERGRDIIGKSFFYIFYPAHFLVLSGIRIVLVDEVNLYYLYLGIHVITLLATMAMFFRVLTGRPNKGQNAICFFFMSAAIYILGFIIEIMGTTSQGYFLACVIQYFGEFMMMAAILMFISEASRVRVPWFVFVIHIVISMYLMYGLLRTRSTGFFYSYIGVHATDHMVRPDLVHSTGFFLTIGYFALICLEVIGVGVYTVRTGSVLEKKRVRMIFWAMFFCWAPYLVTLTGITDGFEIPAVGFLLAGVCLYECLFTYGMLDSVTLASENALDKAREGVLVLDDRYRVSFQNAIVESILGFIPLNTDARQIERIKDILDGRLNRVELNDRIYDLKIEELKKGRYTQGYMIWFLDVTEHVADLKHMSDLALHDPLTGLFNRAHFKELVDEDIEQGRRGCFLMMDMDNFKQVNDRYGHQRGDSILKSLAEILSKYPEEEVYSCRVGGDEFCVYLRNTISRNEVTNVINNVTSSFGRTFRAEDTIKTTLSIGAVANDLSDRLMSCSEMYSVADDRLYAAKKSGKNTYRF